jgi:hypothetical protein
MLHCFHHVVIDYVTYLIRIYPMDNKTTILLDKAAEKASLRSWAEKLGLHPNALNMAKMRGSVSPTVAFCLATELGVKNPSEWALIAAAENERDSKCKQRMLKALGGNGGIRTLDEALHPILP